jgi:hypothetical protein
MVENGELPEWLSELRDQQLGRQLQGESPFASEPQEQTDRPGWIEDLQEAEDQPSWLKDTQAPVTPAPAGDSAQEVEEPVSEPEQATRTDMLDELREQMMLAEEEYEPESRMSLAQMFQHVLSLKPSQRLLLAALLFLNVTVCGCMVLVVAGRVSLPF